MTATATYQEGDSYVECNECGDAIEAHTTKGCTHCPCSARWTRDQIRKERQTAGLPAHFWRPNF